MTYLWLLPNYANFAKGRKRKTTVKIHYGNIAAPIAIGAAGGLGLGYLSETPQATRAITAAKRAASGLRTRGANSMTATGQKLNNVENFLRTKKVWQLQQVVC